MRRSVIEPILEGAEQAAVEYITIWTQFPKKLLH